MQLQIIPSCYHKASEQRSNSFALVFHLLTCHMTLVFRGGNGKIYARTYLNYFFYNIWRESERITSCKLQIKFLNWFIFALVINFFFSPSFIVLQTTIEAQSIYINYTTSALYYYLNEEEKNIVKYWKSDEEKPHKSI